MRDGKGLDGRRGGFAVQAIGAGLCKAGLQARSDLCRLAGSGGGDSEDRAVGAGKRGEGSPCAPIPVARSVGEAIETAAGFPGLEAAAAEIAWPAWPGREEPRPPVLGMPSIRRPGSKASVGPKGWAGGEAPGRWKRRPGPCAFVDARAGSRVRRRRPHRQAARHSTDP
ncbi:hypothetical protein ACMDCR_06270 [Labrys okinawensis]|uniref:hypothetical protein n=1 Tax=Labrys okinawensis TaxID=346911 RepID=UPI0039BCBCFB